MDPSPFLDRDLDDDAEEFIVSSVRELHGSHAFELVVHLGSPPDPEKAAVAEHAAPRWISQPPGPHARRHARQNLTPIRTCYEIHSCPG